MSVRKPDNFRLQKQLENVRKQRKTVNPMSLKGRNLKKEEERLEKLSQPVSQKFSDKKKLTEDKKKKTRKDLTAKREERSMPNIQEQARQLKIKAEDKSKFVQGGLKEAQKRAQQNGADIAFSAIPGLGALGLGAKAIMKGIQAGKTLYKVGNKTFKSKDAAIAAAKKIEAPLPPKAKGNLSPQARGRERIIRKEEQKKKTPSVRSAATKGITKTDAQKKALAKQARNLGAGSAFLGTAAITKPIVEATTEHKKAMKDKKANQTGTLLAGRPGSRKSREIATKMGDRPGSRKSRKSPQTKTPTIIKKIPTIQAQKGPFKERPKGFKSKTQADMLSGGEPRSIVKAKEMGKKTFRDKRGKELAAVTKEQLEESGLSLRDYLNKQRGLTRRKKSGGMIKRNKGGAVRGVGQALRGFGNNSRYSNKMY